ncbi:Protein of unknown function (DUF3602) [Geosmithia morbida]|uniref:Uncharacterized protein n=1 Tax=Geosmithia morbida TaxID=1094350 RepID=A0A9P4YX82_9HYPO|nr:Protein of unknown function (DUF3602) [Geosmithia morbida]KAF4123343.1 Protein of unknown function (DUF3602) [Geosmithia morbida]
MTSTPYSSHGRGGAGNISSSQSPRLDPAKDLETPTLKTPVVTTGRGGTGNMAKNVDAAETRARQDVEARPSSGAQHAGRGGAGNVFKGTDDQHRAASDKHEKAVADEDSDSSGDGVAEKAKKLLHLGGSKKA